MPEIVYLRTSDTRLRCSTGCVSMYETITKTHALARVNMLSDCQKVELFCTRYGGKVFIDLFTLQMVCFECNVEILNEMYALEDSKNLIYLQSMIKEMCLNLIPKYSGTLVIKKRLKIKQKHAKMDLTSLTCLQCRLSYQEFSIHCGRFRTSGEYI